MNQELSWVDFIGLINQHDEDNVCFITDISNSQVITSQVVDFANNMGGKIVIGFDINNYQIHGVRFEQKWLDATIKKDCHPEVDFDIFKIIRNRKFMYLIDVREGEEKPYSCISTSIIPEDEPPIVIPEMNQASDQNDNEDIQAENVLEFKLDNDTKHRLSEIDDSDFSGREKKCLEYLKEHAEITNSIYRELNSVSHKTAHNELIHLVNLGILEQQGQGRTTKYVIKTDREEEKDKDIVESDEINEIINIEDNDSIALENEVNDNTDDLIFSPEADDTEANIVEESPMEKKTTFEDSGSIFEIGDLENGKTSAIDEFPSLFGDDLDKTIRDKNPSVSITQIRRSALNNHMSGHFNQNNDISIGDDKKSLNSDKKELENEASDGLLGQLADIYEQINN